MAIGKRSKSPIYNLFRWILSVAVLSSFILVIALLINGLWNTNTKKFSKSLGDIFSRFNIPVDANKVGNVAGEFVERISQTDLGSGVSDYRGPAVVESSKSETDPSVNATNSSVSATSTDSVTSTGYSSENNADNNLLKIAILSDIHEDYDNLVKALNIISKKGVRTIFVLGDLTNYGDIPSLQKVKSILDNSGLSYYALPGDHDIAQSLDDSNFLSVFGKSSQLVAVDGVSFLLLDNSPNFTALPENKMSWFEQQLPSAQFILLSQPLYSKGLNEPFSNMYMGSTKTPVSDSILKQKQKAVLEQGNKLLTLTRNQQGAKAIISGDHHRSNNQADPFSPSLRHYYVGAVTGTVNDLPQAVIQTSRFSIMTINAAGEYTLEDIIL
jgi:hypothetical protein